MRSCSSVTSTSAPAIGLVQLGLGQRAVVGRDPEVAEPAQQLESGFGNPACDDDTGGAHGRPSQKSPTVRPFSSMSMLCAAGVLPSPGICVMSPHSGTSQPAPV